MDRNPVCHFYQAGFCRNGETCKFVHPTVRCHSFTKLGWCPYSASCLYWHCNSTKNNNDSFVRKPCRFYANNQCKYGEKCNYSHDISEQGCSGITLEEYREKLGKPTVSRIRSPERNMTPEDDMEKLDGHSVISNNLPNKISDSVLSLCHEIKNLTSREPFTRSNNKAHLDNLSTAEVHHLNKTELERVFKLFPSDSVCEVDHDDGARVFSLRFSPTDPDWVYDVREVILRITVPSMYPQEPLTVIVLHDQQLPFILVDYLNECILSWIKEKHNRFKRENYIEPYLRKFFHWLDRNLEDLFTNGLRKHKFFLENGIKTEYDSNEITSKGYNSDVINHFSKCQELDEKTTNLNYSSNKYHCKGDSANDSDEEQDKDDDHEDDSSNSDSKINGSQGDDKSSKCDEIYNNEELDLELFFPDDENIIKNVSDTCSPEPQYVDGESDQSEDDENKNTHIFNDDNNDLLNLVKNSKLSTMDDNSCPESKNNLAVGKGTQKVLLNDLNLYGKAGTFIQKRLHICLHCTRCRLPFEWTFSIHQSRNNEIETMNNYSCESHFRSLPPHNTHCARCSQSLQLMFQASIAHSFTNNVGTLYLNGCIADDIPSKKSDGIIFCTGCNKSVKFLKMEPGPLIDKRCFHCYALVGLRFSKFHLENIKNSTDLISSLKMTNIPDKQNTSRRLRRLINSNQYSFIQEGSPLPAYGTCKHYRKSYRWLRFPCCGRLEPCDVCHDNSVVDGHEMEFATRMVCGFCSKEQAFSTTKPCIKCGKSLSGSHSSHWEGGKGCRNKITMSKKDAKKYSQMNKTVPKGK